MKASLLVFPARPFGALIFAGLLLTGCTSETTPAGQTPSDAAATPTLSIATPSPDEVSSWPRVDENGTGPATVTIPNPSPDAFYFHSTFTCSSGEVLLELVEDPRVFQSGSCGVPSTYQMPLPTDSAAYTFTIEIDPTATYTFTGTFEPR